MKRTDDTIQIEYRDEIHDLIRALEAVPKDAQSDTVKELIKLLGYMDIEW